MNNNYNKIRWLIYISIILLYAFIVILFLLLLLNDSFNQGQSDLGSYFGGIFGGAATLVGVCFTMYEAYKESVRHRNEETEEMIHKSALIIIYDFAFAINDIYLFLENFPTNHEHAFDRKQYQNYINNIYMLTQFYFDSLWIQNVANLYGATLPKWKMIKDIDKSKKMDYEKMRTIYEIYGFFMTIKKSIDNPRDYYLCKNAFDTMNQIFNVSIDKNSKDSAKKNINLNQNINLNYS